MVRAITHLTWLRFNRRSLPPSDDDWHVPLRARVLGIISRREDVDWWLRVSSSECATKGTRPPALPPAGARAASGHTAAPPRSVMQVGTGGVWVTTLGGQVVSATTTVWYNANCRRDPEQRRKDRHRYAEAGNGRKLVPAARLAAGGLHEQGSWAGRKDRWNQIGALRLAPPLGDHLMLLPSR
jgi:hypothetical protein